jgi:hypothetical protein
MAAMVAGEAAAASPQTPRLAPALAAMTGLQALVALALFAPGVLAPKLGIGERDISLLTSVFVVGVATSMAGGMLAARLDRFHRRAVPWPWLCHDDRDDGGADLRCRPSGGVRPQDAGSSALLLPFGRSRAFDLLDPPDRQPARRHAGL